MTRELHPAVVSVAGYLFVDLQRREAEPVALLEKAEARADDAPHRIIPERGEFIISVFLEDINTPDDYNGKKICIGIIRHCTGIDD